MKFPSSQFQEKGTGNTGTGSGRGPSTRRGRLVDLRPGRKRFALPPRAARLTCREERRVSLAWGDPRPPPRSPFVALSWETKSRLPRQRSFGLSWHTLRHSVCITS